MNETPSRILVVDDEPSITEFVGYALKKEGFQPDVVDNGEDALAMAQENDYDLFVLDIMLPGLDGLSLLKRARAEGVATPVLMLTALSRIGDRVDGLEAGADDYLAKPFDLDELAARVEVQLRHRGAVPVGREGILRYRRWALAPGARTLMVDGETEVPLTKIEFNILEQLLRRPSKVFSKAELFELAWGEPYAGDDSTVAVHVSNIRAKLRATGTDGYLKTVWGMGFKLA